jgi:hypothetical protein
MEQWMRHLKRTIPNNNLIVDVLTATKALSIAKQETKNEKRVQK